MKNCLTILQKSSALLLALRMLAADISAYDADRDILRADVYPYIEPQIVTCGNATVMAYIDNNTDHGDYSSPTLVYQVYENGTWSQPEQVDSNDTADKGFDLYTDGKNIYIAYTESNHQLTGTDNVTNTLLSGVTVTCFDVKSNTFTDFSRLSSDDACDYSPVMTSVNGNPAVLWVNNTDNDILGMAPNNAVYLAVGYEGEWITESVITGLNSIVSLDAGRLNGNPTAAVINDEDSDMATINDRSVNVIDLTSNLICAVADKECIENENANCRFYEGSLYWCSDGKISEVSVLGGEITYIGGEQSIGGDFKIVKLYDDRNAIVYKTPTYNGVNLTVLIQNGTEWNEVAPLIETGYNIGGYEIIVIDEKIYVIYVETTTGFGAGSFSTYSDLKFIEVFNGAESEPFIGDVNEDGNIDDIDIVVLKRHLAGWLSVKINKNNSDTNGDGNVGYLDVIKLKRYLASNKTQPILN